jgi:hypothetical protein
MQVKGTSMYVPVLSESFTHDPRYEFRDGYTEQQNYF